ncbi:unnamed protein product [Coregonus sp. 'balchen']|nr:unnamed protein product [Coregonus sp. 'balchen']
MLLFFSTNILNKNKFIESNQRGYNLTKGNTLFLSLSFFIAFSLFIYHQILEKTRMDPIVEVVALLLGFIGWVMVGIAIPNRYWKVSTVDGNVITTSTIYENLWMSCATDSTGVHNCREFPSLLALNGYIQASRALMIAAIIFGSIGLLATLIGMQCSKAAGDNMVLKGRIAGVGGVHFLLQEGLYIGWCSAILAIVGGSCLTCACKLGTSEKQPYPYQPRGTVFSGIAPSQSQAATSYGRNAYV